MALPPKELQVIKSHANFFSDANNPNSLETQVLCGETVRFLRRRGDWSYVEIHLDGYMGWMRNDDLSPVLCKPWHKVAVPQANVYSEPSFKSAKIDTLAMNSRIDVSEEILTAEGQMMRCHLGWIFADQLAHIDYYASDFVTVAMRFVGTPYLWGGRYLQLDCSSLLQQALTLCGTPCDRNAFPQSQTVGKHLSLAAFESGLRRGDLIFWTQERGRHIAIMVDKDQCIHATIQGPYRGVVLQTLNQVIHDQEVAGNGRPTAIRRLPNYLA